MDAKTVVALIPLRFNSQRIFGKNFKMLGGKPLCRYIFDTVLQIKHINRVIGYCSNPELKQYLPDGIEFFRRPSRLDKSEVKGMDIYLQFAEDVFADYYILLHATSPFLRTESLQTGLNKVLYEKYDSAFSVMKFKTFAWFQGKPINYSLSDIPLTQNLEPVYLETSAFFIFSRELLINEHRRIGHKPYIHVCDLVEGIDIDEPEDFEFAQFVAQNIKQAT